jgi:hypothetical protein
MKVVAKSTLKIIKIPKLDTIVIKKFGNDFFITTKNSIVIDVAGFSTILRFLVMNNMLDYNILERIVNERREKE